MTSAVRAAKGMVVSPHHLASAAGCDVLRRGGGAAEAAVAVAATLAVVYPHMNSIGGDSFWLIKHPSAAPLGIDACGRAGAGVSAALYADAGFGAVPRRGPLAVNTVAGAVSGWIEALRVGGATLPLGDLLCEAIRLAEEGVVAGAGLAQTVESVRAELGGFAGFAEQYLPGGRAVATGDLLRQPKLAETLRRLARDGLDSFYRGEVGADLARDLAELGAPITGDDLAMHRAEVVTPLSAKIAGATLYNMPPPTQGVASLLILALFERLDVARADGFEHVHALVEATKLAFQVRNAHVGDPSFSTWQPQALLDDAAELDRMAAAIDMRVAAPWPPAPGAGDTVWFGVIDAEGCAVSAIQSTYFEFGAGLLLPRTGVAWQNRGVSFALGGDGPNVLRPGAKPFHTLNPALCVFEDGRTMVYGTMGGDGQPQTQAAIFTRYARFGQDLKQAVTAPRWLLGRTWGDDTTSLKLEDRFPRAVLDRLRAVGHQVETVAPFTSVMGHAGAIVRTANGALEGAADPRSDGAAAGY